MTQQFSITAEKGAFAIAAGDKAMLTPGKKPLIVPTQTLAEAIVGELSSCHPAFIAGSLSHKSQTTANRVRGDMQKMPLTALAYTAIDRISGQREAIIEVLLVYVDTDTLSYRASGSEALAKRQEELWTPVLTWVGKKLGAEWQITSGVMPIDQSPELHKAIASYLSSLNDMQLAAACILSSGLSSLALTLAVLLGHVKAENAFMLSRLEEEHQAEQWGRDEEAESRANRLKQEIMDANRFLGLLERP